MICLRRVDRVPVLPRDADQIRNAWSGGHYGPLGTASAVLDLTAARQTAQSLSGAGAVVDRATQSLAQAQNVALLVSSDGRVLLGKAVAPAHDIPGL